MTEVAEHTEASELERLRARVAEADWIIRNMPPGECFCMDCLTWIARAERWKNAS